MIIKIREQWMPSKLIRKSKEAQIYDWADLWQDLVLRTQVCSSGQRGWNSNCWFITLYCGFHSLSYKRLHSQYFKVFSCVLKCETLLFSSVGSQLCWAVSFSPVLLHVASPGCPTTRTTDEGQSQSAALRTTSKNVLINLPMKREERGLEILRTLYFLEVLAYDWKPKGLDFNFSSFHRGKTYSWIITPRVTRHIPYPAPSLCPSCFCS